MEYELVYTKKAFGDIKKLDKVAKKRLKTALEKLQKSPLKNSAKLINSKLGQYRVRFGNYRAVFDLSDKKIVILRIGHRREIYR